MYATLLEGRIVGSSELLEAAKEEEIKIPWKEANEGSPVPEEQYQEKILAAKTGQNWIGHCK